MWPFLFFRPFISVAQVLIINEIELIKPCSCGALFFFFGLTEQIESLSRLQQIAPITLRELGHLVDSVPEFANLICFTRLKSLFRSFVRLDQEKTVGQSNDLNYIHTRKTLFRNYEQDLDAVLPPKTVNELFLCAFPGRETGAVVRIFCKIIKY